MIDGAFEGQRIPAAIEGQHTNRDAVFEQHLAIDMRAWVGLNLLVFRGGYVGNANSGNIESIEILRADGT